MNLRRITKHPILEIPDKKKVTFSWNGKKLTGSSVPARRDWQRQWNWASSALKH